MAEATCRRELELEIPAEEVTKKIESVAKEFARIANVPGFRRGKAPVSLIRRKFAKDITDEDVAKTLEEMRERAATFAPVEGRAIQDGDFAQVKLIGTPDGGGDPLQAESVLCHIGAEETMEPFNTNLKGASAGDHKNFDVDYPADYPDPKLAGKKYHYAVEVLGIKTKKLPEVNDDFAKDVSDATTLDELKKKVREGLEHQRDHKHKE